MSCDRCKNVHEAQRTGRTDRSCKCECHNSVATGANDLTIGNGAFVFPDNAGGADLTLNSGNIIDNSGAVGQNY